MTQQEMLDYSKEMLLRGERYTTIALFLKNQNADELTTKIIFQELDKIEKEKKLPQKEDNQLKISWIQLIVGFLLTILGVYYFYLGLERGKISIGLSVLGVSGLILFLKETAKIIVNVKRK